MSRHTVGAPPSPPPATSATMFFATEPSLHRLVSLRCDECGAEAKTFDKRTPEGWTQRFWYWNTRDLCPECSAKPEPPDDGSTYA